MTKKKQKTNFLLDNDITSTAMAVCHMLETRIQSKDNLSYFPIPHLIVSSQGLIVMLGLIAVWDSDSSGIEELTVDCCLDSYLDQLREMEI